MSFASLTHIKSFGTPSVDQKPSLREFSHRNIRKISSIFSSNKVSRRDDDPVLTLDSPMMFSNNRENVPNPLTLAQVTPPSSFGTFSRFSIAQSLYSANSIDSPCALINAKRHPSTCYSNSQCALCLDAVNINMKGEKIIALECGHQCHYNCMSTLVTPGIFPRCDLCGAEACPHDHHIAQDIMSKLLQSNPSPGSTPEAQGIEVKQSEHELVTPLDQIITYPIPTPGIETPFTSGDCNTTSIKSEKGNSVQPKVNVIPQVSKVLVNENCSEIHLPMVANVYMPMLKKATPSDMKIQLVKELVLDGIIQSLQKRIIWQNLELNNQINESQLMIFDYLQVSNNGEEWTDIECYKFYGFFLFIKNDLVCGTIDRSLVSMVHRFSDNIILFDLKSSSVPEIYIRHENVIIIEKWFTFMDKEVPFDKVTTNAWDLVLLDDPLVAKAKSLNKGVLNGLKFPLDEIQFNSYDPLPVKLVLCFSVVNTTSFTTDKYQSIMNNILKQTLEWMNEADKLGLVIIGKDGSGDYKVDAGTFLGFVGKSWSGWDEFEFNVYDPPPTKNENQDYSLFVTTLRHLIDTDDLLDNQNFTKQIITISDDVHHYEIDGYTENTVKPSNACTDYHQIVQEMHLVVLNEESFTLKPAKEVFSLQKMDRSSYQISDEICFKVINFAPGSYFNVVFNVTVDVQRLQMEAALESPISGPLINQRYVITPVVVCNFAKKNVQSLPVTFVFSKDIEQTTSRYSKGSNKGEFLLDIPFFPPTTSAKEAIIVQRQIQLFVIEQIGSVLCSNQLTYCEAVHRVQNEIYEMSKDCISSTSFYTETGSDLSDHVLRISKMLNDSLGNRFIAQILLQKLNQQTLV